jgi:hypothetical protein
VGSNFAQHGPVLETDGKDGKSCPELIALTIGDLYNSSSSFMMLTLRNDQAGQSGNNPDYHFADASKIIELGKGRAGWE